ncbi:TonB-dependent receptor [Bacteroides sp. OttesenSCG-928-N06]|nr:TonB-dependent receptor [Bacteroides sp. OttesenSCG-928-N06]
MKGLLFAPKNTIIFLFCLFLLPCIAAQAQTISIKGTVIDNNGEPIIGANIVQKGTTNGVMADIDGNFNLNVVPGAEIEVTYIGYKPYAFKVVEGKSFYNITLKEDTQLIDEVVVVGYGVQKKKLITGATINVSGDNIQRLNTTNAIGALQSQAPGLNIVQGNGQPGESYVINIRGLGTNTANFGPLYVIDGVAGGSISSLNPADIETIDVLKDAASAAIYGARAANGVILVTTKQGKKGKVQVTYDAFYGMQNPVTNGVKSVSASEYMELINKAQETAGGQPYDFATMIPTQYKQIQNGTWNGTDWFKETTNKNAPNKNHAINITGGGDSSKFSLGFSQSSQEGTLGWPKTSYYDRTTIRMNTEYTLWKGSNRDILKVGENATVSKYSRNGVNTGNIYSNDVHNFLVFTPLLPAYNSKGEFYSWDDQVADSWNWSDGTANPLAKMDINDSKRETYRVQANAWLEFTPIKNLKFRSVYGYRYYMESYRSYQPTYYLTPRDFRDVDQTQQEMSYNHNWSWENTVNYILNIKNHSFDILVGQGIEKWGYGQNVGGYRKQSLFPGKWDFAYLDNAKATIEDGNVGLWGSRPNEGSLASVFGRINYNYKETYMGSIIMRADGSSKFARGHRWGYFPSVSAGWVLTNEAFMEWSKDYVDFFKLRGSWGQNGNHEISDFQYLATIAFNYYNFADNQSDQTIGAYQDIMPNPNVAWETSEQLNFGFDAQFFNQRLNVNFDWYRKTTRDWLLLSSGLASYGTNPPFRNGGAVRNQGVELALNWNDRIGRDFRYGATFNIARNKNKVTQIDNEDGIIHGPENLLSQNTEEFFRMEIGKPMGFFYGYKTAGIFQNQKEIDDWKAAGKAFMQGDGVVPGDVKFIDQNEDGKFNDEDKIMIGNPHPDVTIGFNLNFGYKGIDLSITASGAFGMQVAQSYRSYANNETENYTNNMVAKYWTGEGSTNKFPRFTYGKHANLQKISDIWLEDADYVKIRDITLGYDFKQLLKHKLPLSQLRLFVSLQNFITFTGYSGMDPEVSYGGGSSYPWASGVDLGFYPNPKSVIFGVNLKF